jgi:hypothetical protein
VQSGASLPTFLRRLLPPLANFYPTAALNNPEDSYFHSIFHLHPPYNYFINIKLNWNATSFIHRELSRATSALVPQN